MKYEKWKLWVSLKKKYKYNIDISDVLLMCMDLDLNRSEFYELLKEVMKK